MKLAGNSSAWLERTAFALKFFGGLFIAAVGGLLFWATLTGSAPLI